MGRRGRRALGNARGQTTREPSEREVSQEPLPGEERRESAENRYVRGKIAEKFWREEFTSNKLQWEGKISHFGRSQKSLEHIPSRNISVKIIKVETI